MSGESAPQRDEVLEAIRDEYARRTERWDHRDETRVRLDQMLLDRTLGDYGRLLKRNGLMPLGQLQVCDVGAGRNEFLVACRERWGQTHEQLCGVELMPDRVEKGLAEFPYLKLQCGSADALPWPEGQFDLVHQGMLLSSILDPVLSRGIEAEMMRITRPGGHILWYDFIWNPTNPKARGISLREVRRCFPGFQLVDHLRVTLAPPLSRKLARIAPGLIGLFEACKVLNLWQLALLRKPA